METFTKDEIDAMRAQFESENYQKHTVTYNGENYDYYVIPGEEAPPNLSDFVVRATGEKLEDGAVFAISSNIREKFRKYPILHEIIEFIDIGINTRNRCALATEREINLVEHDQDIDEIEFHDYIHSRRDFFFALIKFATGNPAYTKEDIEEFRKSLEIFEQVIVKKM